MQGLTDYTGGDVEDMPSTIPLSTLSPLKGIPAAAPFAAQGWQCPICKHVNAPGVATCPFPHPGQTDPRPGDITF